MKIIYKIIPYLILAVVCIFLYESYFENKSFKAELDVLRNENDSLMVEYQKIEKVADSVLKMKNKTIIEYKTIYKYLKEQQNETDSIVDSVGDFDEQQLDGTIRTHKHIERK